MNTTDSSQLFLFKTFAQNLIIGGRKAITDSNQRGEGRMHPAEEGVGKLIARVRSAVPFVLTLNANVSSFAPDQRKHYKKVFNGGSLHIPATSILKGIS